MFLFPCIVFQEFPASKRKWSNVWTHFISPAMLNVSPSLQVGQRLSAGRPLRLAGLVCLSGVLMVLTVLSDCICKVPDLTCISAAKLSVSADLCDSIWCVNVCQGLFRVNYFGFPSCRFRHVRACDTYDELWRDDPIHDGTEERRDDSDADENDRCHELKEMKRA